MAGGAGVEYYFGYQQPCTDLNCEDWRSRDRMWDSNRFALNFFRNYLPFHEMVNCNDLIGNNNNSGDDGYCLTRENDKYAVYAPPGEQIVINLSSVSGSFNVRWYDPRNGGNFLDGSVTTVQGGDNRNLGSPPNTPDEDWVILLSQP